MSKDYDTAHLLEMRRAIDNQLAAQGVEPPQAAPNKQTPAASKVRNAIEEGALKNNFARGVTTRVGTKRQPGSVPSAMLKNPRKR